MRKFFRWFALVVFAAALVGPFLVPVNTSGNLTKEAAAAEIWGDESQWHDVGDLEVHFVEAGDPASGRFILLLHGFGASAWSFKENLAALSQIGHVVAFDRPAFGFTSRPEGWDGTNPYGFESQIAIIDAFIDSFGVGKEVILLGHSQGGSIAASYAEARQERLSGLVLFAPAVLSGGGVPGGLAWLLDVPQIDHLGPLLVSSIASSGLDILYSSYVDQSKITDATLGAYTQPLKISGWERAFWEFTKAPRDGDVAAGLTKITIPTLVIAGDQDQIVPTADSIEAASQIHGSELVIIPRTGHLPNEESPAEFASAVVSFIARH